MFKILGSLNANRYRTDILSPFIEELHDDELQQDGARLHTTHANLNFLIHFYDDRVIS